MSRSDAIRVKQLVDAHYRGVSSAGVELTLSVFRIQAPAPVTLDWIEWGLQDLELICTHTAYDDNASHAACLDQEEDDDDAGVFVDGPAGVVRTGDAVDEGDQAAEEDI